MNEYRKWWVAVPDMINGREGEYFSDVSNSARTNPPSFWTERGSIVPKININFIPKDMSDDELYIYI